MDIPIDPMSEDLRRQRRNLILTCFVLCFMKYGGIQITKTSVLGAEVQFNNASAIFFGIWLIWIYFVIRYYQYFMQEGLRKIYFSWLTIATEKIKPILKSIVKSEHPTVQETDQLFDYNILILKKHDWKYIIFNGNEPLNGRFEDFEMMISLWKLRIGIIKSLGYMIFNKSVITDYLFPILFALFTVVYCNLGDWPGTLIRVF